MSLYRHPILLNLVWLMIAVARAGGQVSPEKNSSPYTPTLILDPNKLQDADLSYVVVALSKAKLGTWRRTPLHSSLFETLSREFSFADGGPFPKTALALADTVASVNGISNPQGLAEGRPILVPPLPVRPLSTGADPKLTQSVAVASSRPTMMSVEENTTNRLHFERTPVKRITDEGLRGAATWWIDLSRDQISAFKHGLPTELLRRLISKRLIYIGPTTQMVDVKPREFTCSTVVPVTSMSASSDTTSLLLATLTPANSGTLVIFDRFHMGSDGNCAHGLIVESVARQILQSNAPQLVNNVQRAEVDFFADVTASGKTMDAYISTFPIDNVRTTLQQNSAVLLKLQRDPNNPFVVPLFYIQALLDFYLDKTDSQVISSSVWFKKDGYELLPRDFDFGGSAMLTAAVSDDHEAVEDAVEEPINSFYNRKDFRTLLVGAYGTNGQPFGGFSRTGTGVCCIGAGEGWTLTSQCSVRGTSFSTPEVGAYLYLARAFWHNLSTPVSPQEASLRLLLSSQIHPAWIGLGYASAGPPQLQLLLTTLKKYAVQRDLSVVPLQLDSNASQIFIREDGARFKHQVAISCGGDDGLCGLKVVNGTAFVFRLSKWQWEKVVEIDLNLHFANGNVITTTTDFETHYEGIYSL